MMTLALLVAAVPAGASPASSKREEARQVKQQIDALDVEVENASEEYNEARLMHQALVADMQATSARIEQTSALIEDLQVRLEVRAESMYRNGPLSFLDVLLGAEDFEKFAVAWALLRNMNDRDSAEVDQLAAARTELEAAKAQLAQQEAAAKVMVDKMAANKIAIEKRLAERKRMLSGLEAEIAAIEAAERARAEAAARAAVSRDSSPVVRQQSFPPPTRAPRSEVVNIGKRYLGAPYQWAASGPNRFDCSGYTMFVYRQVGVSLPHSSRAQYGSGEKVSRADLKPGDLVFFGSPIRHVGIYVGGGQYIHSPRTGDVVKISSLGARRDYVGATRP